MTSLKERIASFKKVMKGSDSFYDLEVLEIIQKQQELIQIQAEGLETLKAPKELTEGLVGGWPCVCCGQDVKKIDSHVREILEKTKQMMEKK